MLTRKLFLVCLLAIGCNRGDAPAPVGGPTAAAGWEIRYMAAISLARRGSDKVNDAVVQSLILEMLDEQQQLRNRRKTEDGREVTDQAGATGTVYGVLEALAEHRRRMPDGDLSAFRPAIDKLAGSSNAMLAKRAQSLRDQLAGKPTSTP